MTRLSIDRTSAHRFASALLDAVEHLSDLQSGEFQLPGVTLRVRTNSPDYLAHCRRALVNDPRYADGSSAVVSVTVVDRSQLPGLPNARWTGETFSIAELAAGLAPGGYEGVYDVDRDVWMFFDPVSGRGVVSLPEDGAYAPWEQSFPLRNFLHWSYASRGDRLIHAGTLGQGGRGVLLIGAGGSGKSGTTLSGLLSGLDSVGDDYIAVRRSDDGFEAFPLMKLMKQDAKGLGRLGIDPSGFGSINWQNKYEFDFETLGGGHRAPSLKLVGILLPTITGAERSRIAPTESAAAMRALGLSTLQQLPGGWREGMSFTASICRTLPCFRLELSRNGAEIARTIREFIAERAE